MLVTTKVFDAYWRFAAERLAMYQRRLDDPAGPWTSDPILRSHRFTNAYRVADRVSQYLVSEVQYREDRPSDPDEVFFRTILFKIFNKVETWELLEDELGPLEWRNRNLNEIDQVLHRALAVGQRIYSAAYIMPAPAFGKDRKHSNHLALLADMMERELPRTIANARSLKEVYLLLLQNDGLGPFLAFQYAIDLNYSNLTDFDEDDFVVAGPGALDGIAKCFRNHKDFSAEEVIKEMVTSQDAHFRRLGLPFSGLFGRRLKLIDCQNLFCEISKYARVAFPDVTGTTGRTRIKQSFVAPQAPLPSPYFPPKWGLAAPKRERQQRPPPQVQGNLFK